MPRKFYWNNRKYKNKPKEYNGRLYHSVQEAGDALWLDVLKSQGKIKEIKSQHRIRLDVNGKHICDHIVDFLITLSDGRQKFVETKGLATPPWTLKWKLTEALYPDTPYLVNPTEEELLK